MKFPATSLSIMRGLLIDRLEDLAGRERREGGTEGKSFRERGRSVIILNKKTKKT